MVRVWIGVGLELSVMAWRSGQEGRRKEAKSRVWIYPGSVMETRGRECEEHREKTRWLAAQGETDFKRRKTLERIKGSERMTRVILGLTAQGTHARTWNERHCKSKRSSYFALANSKAISSVVSSGASVRAQACYTTLLVKSNLSRMARGLRGTADGEVIRRGQEQP